MRPFVPVIARGTGYRRIADMVFHAVPRKLRSLVQLELADRVLHVVPRRTTRDDQTLADLLVGQPFSDQA